MLIERVEITGINESLRASGYPMNSETISFARAGKLGSCKPGTGHDCFLKGIVVQADITAPQYWWIQFQRYHFADIVSSQSKMHKITEMELEEVCNKYVTEKTIAHLRELIEYYENLHDGQKKREYFQRVIANCPMGLMLKARIVTNYLQLKTMYLQRHHHKLEEWKTFCEWIEGLPHFSDYTQKGDK